MWQITLIQMLFKRLKLIFTFLLLLPSWALAQEEISLDKIVAVVDGEIVLESEVNARVFQMLQRQQVEPTDELIAQLWSAAFNELIDQGVLLSHAKRDTTIKITDANVNQQLEQRISNIVAQIGGEDKFELAYGKSVLQAKNDLQENIKHELMVQEFTQRKIQQITISPREVATWFKRIPTDSLPTIPELVRLAHIVRMPDIPKSAKDFSRNMATALRDSILTGRSTLEKLATKYTDDPGSKSTGGRGQARLGELVPEFAAVASTLSPGGISQVFETQFGMHIMRVNSLRGDFLDYSHILIKVSDRNANPTNAINFLKAVRDSIETQQIPFELMAKRHSQERSSADVGGYVIKSQDSTRDLVLESMSPRWRLTISKLEIDKLSEPVETELEDGRKAWHIVWLQKKKAAHRISLEDDFALIEEQALNDKRNRILAEWVQRLRKGVYIQTMIEDEPASEN